MTKTNAKPNTKTVDLKNYLIPAFERKAMSITAIDVTNLTSYTDTILIIEGSSKRQVTSIAQHFIKYLKGLGIKAFGMEGVKEGDWALLDYGDIIIHIFGSQEKEFYDLEGLWADAPRIDLSEYERTYGENQ
jgi:ribosome-associated protein